jgi:hypothetical protein
MNCVPLWRGKVTAFPRQYNCGNLSDFRNPEDVDSTFSEISFNLVLHGTKSKKAFLIDTAVKDFQKTLVVFQY